MKRPVIILVALALLLLTAALAPVFKSDPGHVMIHFLDWTIETSVLVLGGALLLLWLLIHWLIRLWKLPAETAQKVREKRALAQLEKGLLALTEGDWRTAERALEKSTSTQGKTTARYLAAAQAADGQAASERREFYLEQADTGSGKKKFLVELTRARLLLGSGARAEALPILKDLHQRRRRHPQVLELLARCHRELGQWDELETLFPALRKAGILSEDELDELQVQIAINRLRSCEEPEALLAGWKALPRAMRKQPSVVEIFAEQAGKLERADLAEPVLRASLKSEWIPSLVLRYGDPGSGNASKRLKQCEKWLEQHPDDASLHMALGRLCAGEELWGKAREHLVRSLEILPSTAGYDALGQLFERQGELELAMACFRNALRLTQGKQALPLPREHARLGPPED
ncbi:MAG: tetratricopeptide repeat protein [Xanthomonadales bacterium]|nr:tetratricopeptide repeat protein [Xanthomonadales bacterium]